VLKIMTIVGTRPEIIKMCRVISEFEKHTHHILVHTGQNYDYELNEVFFNELEINKPNYFLNAAGKNPASTIGNVISKIDKVLVKEKPEAILIYGDTNSALSVIAAKRRKIPIFHMEAGNRSFDQRVPEEINRKIVDHLSDINLVLNEHARRYLIREGIPPETIIKTGSHMPEVLYYYKNSFDKVNPLSKLKIEKHKYFLISLHREENVDTRKNLIKIMETLDAIYEEYKLPIIVSTHPRTKIKLNKLGYNSNKNISFLKPFGFFDYIKLQIESCCTISDSGTITEEASILNIPAITIRNSHERPEGMDNGTVIMSGLSKKRVLKSIEVTLNQHNRLNREFSIIDDYKEKNISKKILRIVLSYIDYINRNVWKKVEN
jgi:UDP-N-acetylglucosamine 2-epimerase (non-hydrolysing)